MKFEIYSFVYSARFFAQEKKWIKLKWQKKENIETSSNSKNSTYSWETDEHTDRAILPQNETEIAKRWFDWHNTENDL